MTFNFVTTFAHLSARLIFFKGLVIGFGPKGRLGRMCNSVVILVSFYHILKVRNDKIDNLLLEIFPYMYIKTIKIQIRTNNCDVKKYLQEHSRKFSSHCFSMRFKSNVCQALQNLSPSRKNIFLWQKYKLGTFIATLDLK